MWEERNRRILKNETSFLPELNNETLELGQVGKIIIDEMKNWCSSRAKGLTKLSGELAQIC